MYFCNCFGTSYAKHLGYLLKIEIDNRKQVFSLNEYNVKYFI